MPELPEIETIRRGLERETVGRRVKSVEVPAAKAVNRNGSRKAFQSRLEGTKIKSVDRRGSLLVFTLDSGDLMVVHIGATGRLERAAPKDETAKDTQIVLNFTQGGQLRMADPEQAAVIEELFDPLVAARAEHVERDAAEIDAAERQIETRGQRHAVDRADLAVRLATPPDGREGDVLGLERSIRFARIEYSPNHRADPGQEPPMMGRPR